VILRPLQPTGTHFHGSAREVVGDRVLPSDDAQGVVPIAETTSTHESENQGQKGRALADDRLIGTVGDDVSGVGPTLGISVPSTYQLVESGPTHRFHHEVLRKRDGSRL